MPPSPGRRRPERCRGVKHDTAGGSPWPVDAGRGPRPGPARRPSPHPSRWDLPDVPPARAGCPVDGRWPTGDAGVGAARGVHRGALPTTGSSRTEVRSYRRRLGGARGAGCGGGGGHHRQQCDRKLQERQEAVGAIHGVTGLALRDPTSQRQSQAVRLLLSTAPHGPTSAAYRRAMTRQICPRWVRSWTAQVARSSRRRTGPSSG